MLLWRLGARFSCGAGRKRASHARSNRQSNLTAIVTPALPIIAMTR